MTVAIHCTSCSRSIKLGAVTCPACGRPLSSDELAALEARFEASNVDYRDAKTAVLRALAASLAAGLMTVAIHGMSVVVAVTSDATSTTSFGQGSATSLPAGLALVTCWFARRRMPTFAVVAATLIWSASLVLPLLLAPAESILGLASAAGVALTLVRLAVLLLLVRGVAAAIQMRRLLRLS